MAEHLAGAVGVAVRPDGNYLVSQLFGNVVVAGRREAPVR